MEFRLDSGAICQSVETSDGYLRLYGRLAQANAPMRYATADGGERHEYIDAADLFSPESLKTFETLPVTNEHPAQRRVDSANYRELGRGTTIPSFVKEVTPIGTFLGQMMTIYDRELVEQIKRGDRVGLSPSYFASATQQSDGLFRQTARRGNHVAVVERPRGGPNVSVRLEGIKTDSEEEDLILVQDSIAAFYERPVEAWIGDYLRSDSYQSGLIERTPITLRSATPAPKPDPEVEEAPMTKTLVPEAPTPHIHSDACSQCAKYDAENADLREQVEALKAQVEALMEIASEIEESLETDSEEPEEPIALSFTSIEEFAETVAQAATDFNQFAADVQLAGVDLVETLGGFIPAMQAFITGEIDLMGAVLDSLDSDGSHADSFEGLSEEETIAATRAAYRHTMALLRSQAAAAAEASANRSDSFSEQLTALTSTQGAPSTKHLSRNGSLSLGGAFLANNLVN